MSQFARWKVFFGPKLHRVGEFLAAQGITMAGNLIYGLLCVRLLPKPEYAKFAVVFSALASVVQLSDIGISTSLVPLIGEKIADLQLIADYVASLRTLAQRLFAIMAPVTVLVFPLMVRRQHWSLPVVAAMVATVLVAAWFARVCSAYGVVLILRRDRQRWYRAQMISSMGTLALLGIFWTAHRLDVWSAILINVAGIVFVAQSYYFRSRKLLGVRGQSTVQKRKAIVHLALPNTVNVIFYAVQGQIPQFLVTVFGITAAVADVGALSRLAQIFVIFAQMNPILLEPYFARLPRNKLKTHYLGAVAAIALVCLSVVALGWSFPQMFLWVLGSKYDTLQSGVLLILIGSSIRYLSGSMWIIHSARRFVYWWNNLSVIALTLLVQVVFLFQGHLGTVRSALMFNIISASASLLVNILCAFYGFIRGPRNLAGATPEVIAEQIAGPLEGPIAGPIAGEIAGQIEGELHG
jgi:O-antigen/teichoic acid export membrane protein